MISDMSSDLGLLSEVLNIPRRTSDKVQPYTQLLSCISKPLKPPTHSPGESSPEEEWRLSIASTKRLNKMVLGPLPLPG